MPKKSEDSISKFWRNVIPEPNSGCWLWVGSLYSNGYGRHQFGGRRNPATLAHRFSFLLDHKEIPDGLDLDHLCRNRCCVNPDHLEPVTRKVNIGRSNLIGKWKRKPKSHCIRGHELTQENTRLKTCGYNRTGAVYICRSCKQCDNDRRRAKAADWAMDR